MIPLSPIAKQIWHDKYRFPGEQSIEDTWLRVATALAVNEKDPEHWTREFYGAMEDYKFLPAGRIMSGAGTQRSVTLINCFCMGEIGDSLDSIFSHLKEAALTMQQGGGIGYDFSTIRPKGSLVKGVDADASGPLSFMDVWNAMCKTIMSAGARRGAMMAVLRCDHPDIEDFIEAKRDPLRLRHFNLSVAITDAFMASVRAGDAWDLVFEGVVHRTVDARTLFDKITRSTYDFAEPGVIFIDRINKRNNLDYCETIYTTNPCGEEPLPPYGSCLLGSINMARFVEHPFQEDAGVDYGRLRDVVSTAIRMMDNVVDISKYPLPQQQEAAQQKRRLGLGMTGVADALAMCCIKYGSADAAEQVEEWAMIVMETSYKTSVDLALEKGIFSLYDRDPYLLSPTLKSLPLSTIGGIRSHGIRNSHLNAIAPTGTISLVADNVSSGIEPIFALSYTRKVLQKDGSKVEEEVSDYAVRLYQHLHPDTKLPDYFVTAQDLTPLEHVRMQAAAQKYCDTAISKTVNVPKDISFEDFQAVYFEAYDSGCKGCTTYRPNAITGSVLEVSKPSTPEVQSLHRDELSPRPEALHGTTYKLSWSTAPHAFYLTINNAEDGTPFEIFCNSKDVESYAWIVALTRMISAVFRRTKDSSFVAEELQQVHDPRGGAWMDGHYVPSLVAAIGKILERHLGGGVTVSRETVVGEQCPKCFQHTLKKEEGCNTCLSCGWSKCS